MKKTVLSLFVIAALSTTIACKDKAKEAETGDAKQAESTATTVYKVEKDKSVIDWTGHKPTGKHTGTVRLDNGEIGVTNGAVTFGKFVIDMNSITVTDITEKDGKTDLENHLKGNVAGKEDHFFDVKKYPQGVFELTAVNTGADGVNMVEGNLTLKDVTKSIKFPAKITIDESGVSIVSDVFAINRTLWNINYASKSLFENLGDKFINDDMDLKIDVKASK